MNLKFKSGNISGYNFKIKKKQLGIVNELTLAEWLDHNYLFFFLPKNKNHMVLMLANAIFSEYDYIHLLLQ